MSSSLATQSQTSKPKEQKSANTMKLPAIIFATSSYQTLGVYGVKTNYPFFWHPRQGRNLLITLVSGDCRERHWLHQHLFLAV